jgi:hypothetical protein
VFVPGDRLVGKEGDGWRQVTSELAFERSGLERIPEILRLLLPGRRRAVNDRFEEVLAETVLHAPSWTLRGGTREILRGIIARGLGLR